MHRIGKYVIDETCFEPKPTNGKISSFIDVQKLEEARQKFNKTHDKDVWYDLIYGLGDSWLQTRMWSANYSTLRNIIHWRTGHKLSEWHQFVEWCKTLPWSYELLFYCNEPGKNG